MWPHTSHRKREERLRKALLARERVEQIEEEKKKRREQKLFHTDEKVKRFSWEMDLLAAGQWAVNLTIMKLGCFTEFKNMLSVLSPKSDPSDLIHSWFPQITKRHLCIKGCGPMFICNCF